jgi:hypothetical protein
METEWAVLVSTSTSLLTGQMSVVLRYENTTNLPLSKEVTPLNRPDFK